MIFNKQNHELENGFSLLESLLVVGLLSGILLIIASLTQDYIRRDHMRGVADQFALVQRAVSDSIDTIEEFDALYNFASANGGVAELSILDPANPQRTVGYAPTDGVSLESGDTILNIFPNTLINANYVPGAAQTYSRFRDTLPLTSSSYVNGVDGAGSNAADNVRLTVLVRAEGGADSRALEVLIVSVDKVSEQNLRSVISLMSAEGGYISSEGNDSKCSATSGCPGTARSAFGNWYTDISNFTGTYWYDQIAIARPASADQGGYLASYQYIPDSVLAGDYLYRTQQADPKLNTMHMPLDLGGQNLVGVDNIEVGIAGAAGGGPALTVNNGVYAQGSVYVASDARITGDLVVDGVMEAGDLTLEQSYLADDFVPAAGVGYNKIVSKNFSAETMTVNNDVSVRDSAMMDNINSATSAAETMDITSTLLVNSTGGLLTRDIENAGSLNVNVLKATKIQTSDVRAARMGVVQGEMAGSLTVDQSLNSPNGKVSIDGNINVNNIMQCTHGC